MMIFKSKTQFFFITILFLFSCSKEPAEEEPNKEGSEITFERGEGGIFIGATSRDKSYTVTISNEETGFERSAQVPGFYGLKSPVDCKPTRGPLSFIKAPAGKYWVQVVEFSESRPYGWEIEVEESKCTAVNAVGTAW